MRARVKDAWPWKSILALGGREYIKGAFRPVPADRETEAEANPHLEIEIEPVPVSVETPPAQPTVEKPPASRGGRGKSK